MIDISERLRTAISRAGYMPDAQIMADALAEIERLRDELDRLWTERYKDAASFTTMLDEIERLRPDAARYRWLAARGRKNDAYDIYKDGCAWTIGFQCHDWRLSIDGAIDEAMK